MSEDPDTLIDCEELKTLVRRVLEERSHRRAPLGEASGAGSSGIWALMAELGWLSLCIPEERGGLGQPIDALAAVYRELGRALTPEPYLSTMACAEALCPSSSEAIDDALHHIIAGQTRIAVQAAPSSGLIQARRAGDMIILNGKAAATVNAERATHGFFKADLDGSPAWILVPFELANLKVEPTPIWDLTRTMSDVSFADAEVGAGAVIGAGEEADRLERRLAVHLDLGWACDSVGGARSIFAETIDYMLLRRQFGRVIGSFQAVKHRCADLLTWLEAAEALTDEAVAKVRAADEDAPVVAASAKLYAAEVFRRVAMEAIQLHGGIGFTWEHDCHLFFKRAMLNEQLGGSPRHYQDKIAVLLLTSNGG